MNEKEKYIKAWKCGAEGASKTVLPVFNYLKNILNKESKILDIGCGNGMLVELLRQEGFYNIYGCDITLEGLKQYKPYINHYPKIITKPKIKYYSESSLEKMDFKNNEFDITFSCDVLEHLPSNLINTAIQEIFRITKLNTFHWIATFSDKRHGFDFHLSVHPINYWYEVFGKVDNKNVTFKLFDRKIFINKEIKNE